MQKARGHSFPCGHRASTACRYTVSGSISLPSQGFFSPFPHGTGSLSVASEYLALGDGPPRFPQDSSCPAVLRSPLRVRMVFAYVAITPYGRSFQTASANQRIGNSTYCGSYNPQQCTRCIDPLTTPLRSWLGLAMRPVQRWVWAVPSSLAATIGIAVAFSSSRY